MVPKPVLEMEMSTMIVVLLHVLRDTNGVEAPPELVKPTVNGQELKPLVKVYSLTYYLTDYESLFPIQKTKVPR